MDNRPRGREKKITGAGKPVQKKGSGLHTGPVGRTDGYAGRTGQAHIGYTGQTPQSASHDRAARQTRASGGGLMKLIIAAVILLGGGGFGISTLLGGGTSTAPADPSGYTQPYVQEAAPSVSGNMQQSAQQSMTPQSSAYSASPFHLSSLLSGSVGNVSSGWTRESNVGKLDTSVVSTARARYTNILGNNQDVVTIMVYMCGTDLESKSGMATSDLKEMLAATIDGNVNILIYTGGCTQWKNNVVSSRQNQIYKVTNGQMECLVENDGVASMTKPATLTRFIEYCLTNYPANRNELIFWDHGGGSLSGYGYDEKNPNSGSMTLKGINEALAAANTKFDFIGFDACLMATLENALVLTPYADYLIASEETEPGVGWYYTNWLTALSNNKSMPTIEIGKNIADDFVNVCNTKCVGQKTTLSVIDLAELESTVPAAFKAFASDTAELLENNDYKVVSDARSSAREFAVSSKIDQVDLVNLAYNLGTDEAQKLADTILGAVKYNRTSSNMTDAYGLSIYFPYKKASKVTSAVSTYDAIGIDSEYSRCIQQFAALESSGQAVAGGNTSPLSAIFGQSSAAVAPDMMTGLLSGLFSGSSFTGKSLDVESTAQYLAENRFDSAALVWSNVNGTYQMNLSEEQWAMVQDLQLNVFYDDGAGYIDLGCDNVFEFTEDGALIGAYDGTWLAVNGQPVAYYYTDTVYDGDYYTITGRMPVLLNGSRADLMIVFDSDHPYGYIAGVRSDYRNGETDTIAKSMTELAVGDEIIFLCDYYSYDGAYQDSYELSDPWTYTGDAVEISNVYIDTEGTATSALYLFTDMYCQNYWTEEIPRA